MSASSWAWLVLLFPLLGSIVIALGNTNTDYSDAQRRIVASFS